MEYRKVFDTIPEQHDYKREKMKVSQDNPDIARFL